MPCDLIEHINGKELDINAVVFTQLQLLLLINNNEKTDFIKGFEKCAELVEAVIIENEKNK